VRDNKLTKITFHDFRHTAASYLIKNGVDIVTIAGIMRHAMPSTTANIHGHVIKDAKQEAIGVLEQAILKNKKSVI